jgi:cell division protease FtsH
MQQTRPYAEATQRIIDQEVSRMLVEAEGRARQLLVDNRKALDAVAALLVERETISGAELIEAVRSSGIRSERHPVLTGS